jgi:phospholipid transport system transporter-binding protein
MAEARLTVNGAGRWLLEGELGFASVPAILAHPGADITATEEVEVDLKGVTRADSAGLALLVAWLRESESLGQKIAFLNVPPQLLSIARVSGLDEILSLSQ